MLKVPLAEDEYLEIHRRHRFELVTLSVQVKPPRTVWGLPDGTEVCSSEEAPEGSGWLFMLNDGYDGPGDAPGTGGIP